MAQEKTGLGNLGTYSAGDERVPHVSFADDQVTIHDYRDSRYPSGKPVEVRWRDETFDPAELTNMWVYFSYFGKVQGVAHTEVGFEFADGRCAVASFEVRTLEGQHYSIIKGFGRNFEMALRWASERDILSRRFRWWEKGEIRTYMFEGDVTHGAMVRLFRAFVDRTNELYEKPEWYNTATNTCTTAMMDTVGRALPGQLPRTLRVLLPGMLPKLWARHGIIKYEGDFSDALDDSLIIHRALAIGDVEDFSVRLHGR